MPTMLKDESYNNTWMHDTKITLPLQFNFGSQSFIGKTIKQQLVC